MATDNQQLFLGKGPNPHNAEMGTHHYYYYYYYYYFYYYYYLLLLTTT